jgi:hypothetical protein
MVELFAFHDHSSFRQPLVNRCKTNAGGLSDTAGRGRKGPAVTGAQQRRAQPSVRGLRKLPALRVCSA